MAILEKHKTQRKKAIATDKTIKSNITEATDQQPDETVTFEAEPIAEEPQAEPAEAPQADK